MPEHRQALAQVLQTAKRHVADRNMRTHPLRRPVIDRADLQIMLIGAEAGFDFPQLMIAAYEICGF